MNLENMKKVRDAIAASDHFDMSNWCGTSCCIAGHATILATGKDTEFMSSSQVSSIAQEFLDLSSKEASTLFIHGWGSFRSLDQVSKAEVLPKLDGLINGTLKLPAKDDRDIRREVLNSNERISYEEAVDKAVELMEADNWGSWYHKETLYERARYLLSGLLP
jgi:hypothetical protein